MPGAQAEALRGAIDEGLAGRDRADAGACADVHEPFDGRIAVKRAVDGVSRYRDRVAADARVAGAENEAEHDGGRLGGKRVRNLCGARASQVELGGDVAGGGGGVTTGAGGDGEHDFDEPDVSGAMVGAGACASGHGGDGG